MRTGWDQHLSPVGFPATMPATTTGGPAP